MRTSTINRMLQDKPKTKTKVSVIYARLFSFVWVHKKQLFLAVGAIGILSILNFIIPQMPRIAIDHVIPSGNYPQLIWVGLTIVVTALFIGVFNFASTYLMSLVGQRTIFDIRNKLYRHLQDLSMSFFENRRTGDLMSRVTNDVNTLQQLITSGIIEIFKDLLIFLVILAYLFYADWQLTVLLLVTFPIILYLTQKFARRIRGAYSDVQQRTADINVHLQDTLSSMKLIKSFTNESYETSRFEERNQQNMKANITAVRYWASYAPLIEILNNLGLAIVIVFGSFQAINGRLTVGELVAFLVYLRMLQQPIRHFTRIINVIQQSAAASERIFEILDTQVEITDKENAVELPPMTGHIQMVDIDFSYQQTKVLRGFSLDIKPGMTIALVGPSGAGKSTVTNLISRFYDPQHGRILFDGYDIRDVTLKSLRGQIGIVTQEIMLLNETIRENIAYGKTNANDEEIERAAKMANAHDFIMALPKGYDTPVGERGIKLSGGQRQRLSIARALVKDPRLLILDEATSSLDSESENLIQEALAQLLTDRNRTSLVIAHRLSTIQRADLIVVLENGEIVEQGTHTELLQQEGKYANLYELQFPQSAGEQSEPEHEHIAQGSGLGPGKGHKVSG